MNLHKDEKFVAHCHVALNTFFDNVDKVNFAFIATADGFEVASRFFKSLPEEEGHERLAAVGSSMMALGSSLAQEFGLRNCRDITVDSDTGKIIIHPIITPIQSFTFLVQAQSESLLGMIMHGISKVDESVKKRIQQTQS